jgi:hypothetical protein
MVIIISVKLQIHMTYEVLYLPHRKLSNKFLVEVKITTST